jgi:hypothetical protein
MLRRQRQQVVGPGSSSEGTTSSALFPFADNMKEPARRTQKSGSGDTSPGMAHYPYGRQSQGYWWRLRAGSNLRLSDDFKGWQRHSASSLRGIACTRWQYMAAVNTCGHCQRSRSGFPSISVWRERFARARSRRRIRTGWVTCASPPYNAL